MTSISVKARAAFLGALVGAWSVSGLAAPDAPPAKPAAKVAVSRQTMRYGQDPFTGAAQAVIINDGPLVHTAQILPWGRAGEIVGKGDAALQVEQVLKNILVALSPAEALSGGILKINFYVAQPEVVDQVKQALAQNQNLTGQCAVSIVMGNLTHPDALVAADAVAVAAFDTDNHAVKRFRAMNLPGLKSTASAILPGGGRYYVSGQAKNGPLPEAVKGTLASIESTLTFLGLEKSNVVQLKAYMQPISESASVQAEITQFFAPSPPPPVVFVEWSSPTNTPIEIEFIAADSKPQVTTGDTVEYLTPPFLVFSKVFSRVAHVTHGRTIYFSSFYGSGPTNSIGQVTDIFVNLDNLLPRVRTDFGHLVKATYYVTDNDASNRLNDIRPKFYNPDRPPAASKAFVKGVGFPGKTAEVELIGVAP